MENSIDLTQYGNLPRHVRESLATAKDKLQPSEEQKEEQKQPTEENQSQENVIDNPQQTDGQLQQENEEHQTKDHNNEVQSWKGRLNKLQAEHKTTNERLVAEVEARQKAEQEAREMREKLAALEKQNTQSPLPSQPPQIAPTVEVEKDEFSEEEIAELEMTLGPVGKKLATYLRKGKQPSQPIVDVEKVIDERFKAEHQRNEEQAKAETFGKALNEHAPSLQGLLNDSAFIEYMNTKVIDFAGNTATAFLSFVGQNKRADLVPQIGKLIAEYEQLRQSENKPPQVTAPPSNKGAATATKQAGKKLKPTPAVLTQIRRLARMGEVEKLKELQGKYDLT